MKQLKRMMLYETKAARAATSDAAFYHPCPEAATCGLL
jgi:hypothetical protein